MSIGMKTLVTDNYQRILKWNLAAPSTVSGWRKLQRHPEWVEQLYSMQLILDDLMRENQELITTIKVLSKMVKEKGDE